MRPGLATPLDHYLSAFLLWLQGMWAVWAAIGVIVVIIVAAVAAARARARAHARVPRYRRDTGPIPVSRSRREEARRP